jgi:hypothetical protein
LIGEVCSNRPDSARRHRIGQGDGLDRAFRMNFSAGLASVAVALVLVAL